MNADGPWNGRILQWTGSLGSSSAVDVAVQSVCVSAKNRKDEFMALGVLNSYFTANEMDCSTLFQGFFFLGLAYE